MTICPVCNFPVEQEDLFCKDCGFQVKKPNPGGSLITRKLPVAQNSGAENLWNKRIPSYAQVPGGNPRKAMSLPDGFLLNEKYRLRFLTAGGMGIIYLGIDIRTNIKYIIKEAYSPDIEDKEIMTMALLKERDVLARLNYPGIVKGIDLFQYLGTYYLVLEYVQGKNLDFYAHNRKMLQEKDLLNWALQLCDTLDYLHNLDPPLIYRDLKPENIIVDVFERVKLIDFGIARRFNENKSKDTIAIGTPGFAAPEQYGRKQTDHRADIFSLGATMHYLLTGSDPRERKNPLSFPPLEELTYGLNTLTIKIINKAINLNREERYQTAKEMKMDIEFALDSVRSLSCRRRDALLAHSNPISLSDVHPGIISFVLPLLASFLSIFSLGFTPLLFLSPFIVGCSFIVGIIFGIKGIIRDIKTRSYGMLIISIMGTAINLLPTVIIGLILIAIIFSSAL